MTSIHPFSAAFASSSSSHSHSHSHSRTLTQSRRSLAPPQNQSHSRPSLFKRHTAPSPAALLQLPTLEALPPTPPPPSPPSNSPSFQRRVRRTASSSCLPPPPTSSPPPPVPTMPLLKIRRRPQSPRDQTSFLPFDIPPVVLNTFGFNGTQRSPRSRRSPLSPSSHSYSHGSLSTPPAQIQPDTDHSFLPFSSSTPPSSLSRAAGSTLQAFPSIEGVIDELYGLPPPNSGQTQSPSNRAEKDAGTTVNRDTMKLPLMSPPRSTSANAYKDDEPLNMSEWEWEAFGPMSTTVTIPKHPLTRPSSPASSNPPRRDTSLSLPQDFRPSFSRTGSSSRSMPSRQPSHQPHQNAYLPAQDEGIDEEELKAMEVLEHLSGQLLRDQWGYGTGRLIGNQSQSTMDAMNPDIGRPSLMRSRSETSRSRSSSRPSMTDTDLDRIEGRQSTMSRQESKESTSLRSWRDARKRSKQSPMIPTRVDSFNAHIRTKSNTRRAPPPPPILPLSSDTSNRDPADANIHTFALEPDVQAVNNRLSDQTPPPIPPRSAQRQRLSAPNSRRDQKSLYPQSQRSSASLTSRASKESKSRKVPLILSTSSPSQLEEEEVVVITNNSDARYQGMSLPPIQQRPLPPIPIDQPSQSQHHRSDSLAQRRLTARILRPKRPVTGASLPPLPSSLNSSQRAASGVPASRHESITLSSKSTPPKLVPRDERQPIRRFSSSNDEVESDHGDQGRYLGVVGSDRGSGRRKGMSAFSFLALDERAAEEKPSPSYSNSNSDTKDSRNKPRRRASSFGSIVSTASHSRHTSSLGVGNNRPGSPTPAYIIPPSERSKIGIEERRERRRRQRGSQSSISSVAGSDLSDPDPDSSLVIVREDEELYEHLVSKHNSHLHPKEKECSSAHTYNQRIREGTFSTTSSAGNGNGTRRGFNTDVGDMVGGDDRSRINPLSPLPRPVQTPTHLILNTSSNWNGVEQDGMVIPKTPSLLPPPRPRRNTSHPKVPTTTNNNNKTTGTPVLITRWHANDNEAEGFGFQREFIDLSSPSPSPATPHPPVPIESQAQAQGGRRKVSDNSSGTGSGDGESFWSTDEQERRRITNEWLKSKPTKHAYAAGISTSASTGEREGAARDHPFFR